ncbi:uncharacterized protein LOC121874310 isoform X2 [Homarus americanus]|uniref:uncharacterized protein LOC121874310 isoform X2 n=1 Tax=Homarus americanus TaxID=6706 RepID=UPI001C490D55|nr:uncharacterized protein LOC121874310 isoform X2 [Homarus americanus]XP_042234344.1 uncharacterized protein LOC121874310 isoform X2 [Homarus americanus]
MESSAGFLWMIRVGRWNKGHRALITLIIGASLCLLVLAFTPHPDATLHRSPSHGIRRIQETDDYTGPKHSGQAPPEDNPSLSSTGPENLQQNSPHSAAVPSSSGPYSLPFLSQPKIPLAMDIPRNKKEVEHVMKAQETAITALQHGYKLTTNQKNLLANMNPKDKKVAEERVSKLRTMQEKAYLMHLRAKKQIIPLKGGGERITSTPRMQVRLPVSLKKLPPEQWPPQHRIFSNLTHYPWVKNEECANYSITFKPSGSLPTRALVSFPSSGNTWIRYLIEGATGIFTGSLYDDSSLTRKGMYGEGIVYDSGMTILQKSHGYTTGDAMKLSHEERRTKNHMDELSHQGVLVIRNPFKALISHRHLDVGGHTGYAPKAHFLGKGWTEFVTLKVGLWKDFNIDWLTLSKPKDMHVTFYENLKIDPVEEMRKILRYLKLPDDEDRLHCVGSNTDGLFKKASKNVPLDFNPFTSELNDVVYKAIHEVNSVQQEKKGSHLINMSYMTNRKQMG